MTCQNVVYIKITKINGTKITLCVKSPTFKVYKLTGFIGDAVCDNAITSMPSAKIAQNNNNKNLTILHCTCNKNQYK